MTTFLSGLLRLRRGPWEMLATILIALGVVMLMQPFFLWAYTWSSSRISRSKPWPRSSSETSARNSAPSPP